MLAALAFTLGAAVGFALRQLRRRPREVWPQWSTTAFVQPAHVTLRRRERPS